MSDKVKLKRFYFERFLPDDRKKFVALAIAMGIAVWAIGGVVYTQYDNGTWGEYTDVTDKTAANDHMGDILAFLYFLPIHFIVFKMITTMYRNTLSDVKGLFVIDKDQLKHEARWMSMNIPPLLIAAAFLAYDALKVTVGAEGLSDGLGTVIDVVWLVQWIVFGYIVWTMFSFIFFVRIMVTRYPYSKNLVRIVQFKELKPLTNLALKIALAVIIFTIADSFYMDSTVEVWLSNQIAFFALLGVQVLTFITVQLFVSRDLKHETKDRVHELTMRYIKVFDRVETDPESVSDAEMRTAMALYNQKMDLVLLRGFDWTMILRLMGAMALPLSKYFLGSSETGIM